MFLVQINSVMWIFEMIGLLSVVLMVFDGLYTYFNYLILAFNSLLRGELSHCFAMGSEEGENMIKNHDGDILKKDKEGFYIKKEFFEENGIRYENRVDEKGLDYMDICEEDWESFIELLDKYGIIYEEKSKDLVIKGYNVIVYEVGAAAAKVVGSAAAAKVVGSAAAAKVNCNIYTTKLFMEALIKYCNDNNIYYSLSCSLDDKEDEIEIYPMNVDELSKVTGWIREFRGDNWLSSPS